MSRLLAFILFCIGLFGSNTESFASNTIYVDDAETKSGETLVLSVKMRNDFSVTGFQFDLVLPDGFRIAEDEGFPLVSLSTSRTTSQKTNGFDGQIQTNGNLRVLCYSTRNYAFSGNDGEVCTIKVNVDENISPGNYSFIIKNIELTDNAGNPYIPENSAFNVTIPTEQTDEPTPSSNTTFTIDNAMVLLGKTQMVTMKMSSKEDIASFQMDVFLPEGMTFVTTSAYKPKLTDWAGETHSLSNKVQANGALRLVAVSMDDEAIPAGDGDLLTFYVTSTENMELKKYAANIKNIVVTPYAEGAKKETIDNIDWEITLFNTYDITASSGQPDWGTVTIEGAENGKAVPGTTVTVEATAVEGYEFVDWSDGSKENPYSFVVDGDKDLVARFTPCKYDVVFDVAGNKTTKNMEYGSVIEKPDDPFIANYVFLGWSPDFVEGTTVPVGGITYTANMCLKGDINQDGDFDVTDVTELIRYIINDSFDPLVALVGDADEDGTIDVMDVTLTIRTILNDGIWAGAKALEGITNSTPRLEARSKNSTSTGINSIGIGIASTSCEVRNIQFDVILPNGVEFVEGRMNANFTDHIAYVNKIGKGVIRVMCVSLSNTPLNINDDVVNLKLLADYSCKNNETIEIDNIVMAMPKGKIVQNAVTVELCSATDVNKVYTNANGNATIFDTNGVRDNGRRGIKIIKKSNGENDKVVNQ